MGMLQGTRIFYVVDTRTGRFPWNARYVLMKRQHAGVFIQHQTPGTLQQMLLSPGHASAVWLCNELGLPWG